MSSATETPSISLSPLCEKRCCRNDSGSGSGAIDNEQLHTLFTQLLYKLLGVDMRAASAQEVFRALRCSTQVSSFSVKTAYSGAMRASLCSMYVAQIAVLPRVFCYRRGENNHAMSMSGGVGNRRRVVLSQSGAECMELLRCWEAPVANGAQFRWVQEGRETID